MVPELREYQKPAVEQALYFFRSNKIEKPRIVVAPTAAGKSIIIAAVAAGLEGRVLVFQPSVELLKQNVEKYRMYSDDVAIYSASMKERRTARVTFSTIGTAVKNAKIFEEFQYLVVDELHLYPISSSTSMFTRFVEANPQLKILGLTATPFRLVSGRGGAKLVMLHSSGVFRAYQHIIQIQDIAPKYWAKIDYIFGSGNKNLLRVNSTGAEYTDESLRLYAQSLEDKIDEAIHKAWDLQTLIYMPSVKEAEALARKHPGTKCLSAQTPAAEREKIMDEFRRGEFNRLVNCQLFVTGLDVPTLRCIIDCVPTLSLARHYQKYGRLTRVHPRGMQVKKAFIDFAGNTERFGYMEQLEMRKVGTVYHFFSGNKQVTGVPLATLDINAREKYTPNKDRFEDMVIYFGKFKGKRISQCETWWLSWAWENLTDERLVKNIKMRLDYLDAKKKQQAV
jgi:DNA repair protein RadD